MKNKFLSVFLVLILCFTSIVPVFAASGSGGGSHSGGVREEPVDVSDYIPLDEAWDFISGMCEDIGDFLGSLGTGAAETITTAAECASAALSAVYGNLISAADSFDFDAFINYILDDDSLANQLLPKIHVDPVGGGFYIMSLDIPDFKQVLIDYLTSNNYVENEDGGFGLVDNNLIIGSGVWLEIPANSAVITGEYTSITNGTSYPVYYTLANHDDSSTRLDIVFTSFHEMTASEGQQIIMHGISSAGGAYNNPLTYFVPLTSNDDNPGFYLYGYMTSNSPSINQYSPVIPYSSELISYYDVYSSRTGGYWTAVNDFFNYFSDASTESESTVYITNNEKNIYYSMTSLYNNWETIINNNYVTYGSTYSTQTNISNIYNYSYYNLSNTYNYNSEIPYWLVDNAVPAYNYSNFALPDGFGVYEFDNPLNDNNTIGIDFSDGFDFDASSVYLSDVEIQDVDASFINAVVGCVPEKILAVFTVFLSLMIAFTLLKSF